MVFPQTNLPLHIDALIGGTWTDLVAANDVYARDGVTIRAGLSSEGSTAEPSSASFTLKANGGKYSPRMPTSPNFGKIGRNTPVRVSVDQTTSYLSIDAPTGTTPAVGCSVSTPDAAALDIVGDLDLRVDLDLTSWSEYMELVSKWTNAGGQCSFMLALTSTGTLQFQWSSTGTSATSSAQSDRLPISQGRLAVRVTFDVDNGAGGRVTTFYTGETIAGPWTQLGRTRVGASTTSIFAGSAPLVVLDAPNATPGGSIVRGRVFAAQVRNGIGGTVVANPDFTAQNHGVTSFTDSAGRTWTLNGAVSMSKRDYRFHGEIPAWPIRWNINGRDVYTTVDAAGIMRRLGQGASPLRSPLVRSISTSTSLVAYWPVEDGSDSQQIASGMDAGAGAAGPMYLINTPTFSTNSEFPGSDPVAEFNGASFNGRILNHVFTGEVQVRFVAKVAAGSPDAVLARVYVRGTAFRWDLVYGQPTGTLQLLAYDVEGTLLGGSAVSAFDVTDQPGRYSIELATSGANVTWRIAFIGVGARAGNALTGSMNAVSIGAASRITMNPNRNLTDSACGHVTYQNVISTQYDVVSELNGFTGELAGARFVRLCREEDIDAALIGDVDTSAPMGVQRSLTFLDLLRECAFVDGGLMYEPREFLGLAMRTRDSLQSQPAALSVPYGSLATLDPVEDDAFVVNDVTVKRPNGSSVRAALGSGPLSYLPPPAGIGRYDTQLEVNVADDGQLPNQAGWRLHVGTVDEARYPNITIGQENARIAGSTTIVGQLAALALGDRVDVTGPPAWLPPETISQLAIGWTEQLGTRTRSLTLVCVPESPFRVPRYASTVAEAAAGQPGAGRYSSSGTTLVGAESSTDTSWAVTTPSGPPWTTDPTQLPLDLMVEGERVRVTAISGTTSSQTFTVTRSINGVVKTHGAGAQLVLFQPAIYG